MRSVAFYVFIVCANFGHVSHAQLLLTVHRSQVLVASKQIRLSLGLELSNTGPLCEVYEFVDNFNTIYTTDSKYAWPGLNIGIFKNEDSLVTAVYTSRGLDPVKVERMLNDPIYLDSLKRALTSDLENVEEMFKQARERRRNTRLALNTNETAHLTLNVDLSRYPLSAGVYHLRVYYSMDDIIHEAIGPNTKVFKGFLSSPPIELIIQ